MISVEMHLSNQSFQNKEVDHFLKVAIRQLPLTQQLLNDYQQSKQELSPFTSSSKIFFYLTT